MSLRQLVAKAGPQVNMKKMALRALLVDKKITGLLNWYLPITMPRKKMFPIFTFWTTHLLAESLFRVNFPGRLLWCECCRNPNLGQIYSPASLDLPSTARSCATRWSRLGGPDHEHESWLVEKIWSADPPTTWSVTGLRLVPHFFSFIGVSVGKNFWRIEMSPLLYVVKLYYIILLKFLHFENWSKYNQWVLFIS